MPNHPSRNWRRRMRDAADSAALALADKRWRPHGDKRLATLMAWEAYMLGWEAGREDVGRKSNGR